MAQMMQILQLALQQNQQSAQQANQDRGFQLDQQQLAQREQQFQQAQKQQEQQAIMAALSRAHSPEGFSDPTALYNYLSQLGIQLPQQGQTQQEDSQTAAAKAKWAEIQAKLSQQ